MLFRLPSRPVGVALVLLGLLGLGLTAHAAGPASAPAPAGGTATGAGLPPAVAFYRDDILADAALSPSGRYVAALVRTESRARNVLVVTDLGDPSRPRPVAAFSDLDVLSFRWVDDEWLVYNLYDSQLPLGEQRFNAGLFSVKRDGTGQRQLVRLTDDAPQTDTRTVPQGLPYLHRLLHVPAPGREGSAPEVVVGELRVNEFWEIDLVIPKRLNVATGAVRTLDALPPNALGWWFAADGEPRLASSTRDGRTRFWWRGAGDEAWRVLGDHPSDALPWQPAFVDAAGQLHVTVSEGPAGESRLRRFDLARGEPGEVVVSTPGFDFEGGPVHETAGGRTLGIRVETDAEQTVWFDPAMKAAQADVDARLPGRINRLTCRRCDDPATRTVLVRSWSDRDPGSFWVLRAVPGQPRPQWIRLGAVRSGIDPARMGAVDFQRIRARDGRDLPVWITTPHDFQPGQRRPAVVLVHGGPWVRGGWWRWSADAQFLASRGYVVIEPEFRGSAGYGMAHLRAGDREWGRAMQDDVTDATRWAATAGLIDPKRTCIAGASYGGYATLMGLIREPELYRCGIAWVAVTDPRLLFASTWRSDLTDEARRHLLPARIGDPRADAARLAEVAPIERADRIRAPLLLGFGENDRRVPLQHGTRLRDTLKAAGRDPEYVVYGGEGHGWLLVANRVDWAQRMERFLAEHLKR